MELNEFKFCPFKKFLPAALRLEEHEQKNKNKIKSKKKNTIAINENVIDEDEEDEVEPNQDEINNANNVNNNYLNQQDKEHPENLILKENDVNANNKKKKFLEKKLSIKKTMQSNNTGFQYIDFSKFCEIMKLFNVKYPVDLKIRCNLSYFFIYSLFQII
jgi:hypothetical protein